MGYTKSKIDELVEELTISGIEYGVDESEEVILFITNKQDELSSFMCSYKNNDGDKFEQLRHLSMYCKNILDSIELQCYSKAYFKSHELIEYLIMTLTNLKEAIELTESRKDLSLTNCVLAVVGCIVIDDYLNWNTNVGAVLSSLKSEEDISSLFKLQTRITDDIIEGLEIK